LQSQVALYRALVGARCAGVGREMGDESSRAHEEAFNAPGCLYEGVRYGPGSAMMGSRRCEYCYCISGARRCIRPKCLLPLPGCAPLYAPHSCCPVAYNCSREYRFLDYGPSTLPHPFSFYQTLLDLAPFTIKPHFLRHLHVKVFFFFYKHSSFLTLLYYLRTVSVQRVIVKSG
jgi:hypothetical protein